MKNIIKICTVVLLLCLPFSVLSQIVIYKKDNAKIFADRYEVRSNNIIYWKGKSQKQSIISKEDVVKIAFFKQNKYKEEIFDDNLAYSGKLPISIGKGTYTTYIYDAIAPSALTNAGAQVDDIITHIDGIPIGQEYDDFTYGNKGGTLTLTLKRNNKTVNATFYFYKYDAWESFEKTLETGKITDVIEYTETPPSGVSKNNKANNSLGYFAEPDYSGFTLAFTYGVGGSSFKGKEPLKFVYEFELGYTNPYNNNFNGIKVGIHEYRKHFTGVKNNREKMYAFNYRYLYYAGKQVRTGFNVGFDIGLIYVPNSNGFFWQPGFIAGYDFRIYKHIRLGLIGEVYLLPTYRFSNLAVGGYGGIKLTGLF